VSAFDRRVYQQIASYAFGEAIAWPGQATVARDLGCSRQAVNRAVQWLVRAGWLEVIERRPGRRGWTHCVYALLAPFTISRWVARRIVDRARRRRLRGVSTNPKGQGRRDVTNGAPERTAADLHRSGSVRSATKGSP
jgi:helix-turn-helix protein